MGLLDSVIGSVTGSQSGGSGGTSPLTKALLLMLAAKAASSYFGRDNAAPAGASPQPGGTPSADARIQSGVLAGMPSLDSLLQHFRGSGQESKVQSWIGTGPNQPLEPHELGSALSPEVLAQLERETGLPRDQLLKQLSTALPQVVDKLTPDGHLPPQDQRSHW